MRLVGATALLLTALLAGGCGVSRPSARASDRPATPSSGPAIATPTPTPTPIAAATPPAGAVRVVAAGDIACRPGQPVTATQCQQVATAKLAASLDPAMVLTLGDNQYDDNTLEEYRGSYAPTWGALLDKTKPVIGNHEYHDPGARGYYDYFADRQPGPPGYYRTTAGSWEVFALNSNCDRIDCASEAGWFEQQLLAHPARCTLVAMHHPRFSSGGEHGDDPAVQDLWEVAQRHGVDLMLAGHDHDYERFAPMTPTGPAGAGAGSASGSAVGMTEIVVGTGGRNQYPAGTRKPGSEVFDNADFGVLDLGLGEAGYTWAFRTIDGRVADSGTRECH